MSKKRYRTAKSFESNKSRLPEHQNEYGEKVDTNRLIHVLLGIGGIATVGALLWWASFYTQVVRELGGSLTDVVSCLYTFDGPCGVVAGFAQLVGATPYNPVVFWIGVGFLVVGMIMKFSLKNDCASSE